ncbi:unnamed protein product [Rotaria magnacalcarata]|uniref:HAT C-terminal dimerisation domain-containing protein n=2 Tax=Rotaria magnacalcarata TaxID=392030 RepID=A0A819PXZ4_9BILA|nr:unnamed protein product [Rotaria magnacalcarata]
MRDFLAAAVPGYPGPHERTLQRNIKKLYANKLFELREKLKNVQYVCLTTDLWRRPRQHHYLCATIHYVDENFGNVSTIVSCRRFHGRHLAVRIRNHICRIVNRSQNFDVDDDSDGIQNEGDEMDESDQEDELNDELEDREEETPTTLDDDSDGSGDHDSADDDDDDDICEVPEDDTDNVSSDEEPEKNETTSDNNAFDIKDISCILYNCRKLVNIINKSSILHEFTGNLARSTVSTDLIVDMRIRWNSTCKMISRLIDYRPALTMLIEQLSTIQGVSAKQKKLLIKLQLSNYEWDVLKQLKSTLLIFSDASEMLSGQKYPSFATAYDVIGSLNHYLQLPSMNNIEMKIKNVLDEALRKYVQPPIGSQQHNLLLLGAFFHPSVYVLMNDHDRTKAKNLLISESNKSNSASEDTTSVQSSSTLTMRRSQPSTNSSTKTISTTDRLKAFREKCGIIETSSAPVKSKTITLRQELIKYETFDKNEQSFASFWKKYVNLLPQLSNMARRYGSVPASSVPCESSFSIANHIVRKTRTSLTPKNLKYSLFLKDKM